MIKEIYFDLDGVLADFTSAREQLLPNINKDDFEWEELHALCPTLYYDLELTRDAHMLWSMASKICKPKILTAIPRRWHWPDACAQKRDWVHKHFGSSVEVFFGPFAIDKQFYCKGRESVLIDDMSINILQWRSRDGTGILHHDTSNTLDQLSYFHRKN